MTDLQNRIAALTPEQRALLEKRLADRVGPAPEDRITPRDRTAPVPLSIQQQREWAFGQYRAANNIPGAFRVEGEFDRDLLGAALTEVIERHEVLRSTVEHRADGTRVQVVHPVEPVPVPVEDLTHLSDAEQRAEIHRRWEAEVVTPFPPAGHQRLRISLLHLAPARHVVLITTDHAAADLVSMGILVQEFAASYGLRRAGGGSLPPVEIQYGDFAVWQRAAEARTGAAELAHWQQTLEGVPGGLALPSDRPLPIAPTYAGAVHERDLVPELTAALRRFAERERVSFGVVLFAAAAILLHRYTGRRDLVISEVVSGRSRSEIERIIGCFVGALPMRIAVSGEQPLGDVVRQARETVVTAYGHQDIPVDGMLDRLELGEDVTASSLIDMWLDVRTPPAKLEVPGLKIVAEPMQSSLAAAPLTLGVNPDADDLRFQWLYMTELFDDETVVLLAGQFERILATMVNDPLCTVEGVPLTDEPGWASVADERECSSVVESFRHRVALAPHAPAVVYDGIATSYAELDRNSDRLARRLRACGAGPEVPVGILLDRSPALPAAILGVLKSGAAYVPLDVTYAPERSAAMLADAGVRVLLTQERHARGAADAGMAAEDRIVLVDGDGEEPAGSQDDRPFEAPDPRSLAYIVFTSGSTGRPKGAMIEHRSLATYAHDVVNRLGLGSGDRFLQFASPGFDVLAEELFPTWLAGGCVVIPARSPVVGGDDLAALAERERVTVLELPTAYWHEWVRELDHLGRSLPECLRLVIIGGERILPDRLSRWRRLGTPLVHVYGLTETTVSSTFFRLDPADPDHDRANLPIGVPLPSAELRLLDHRLRPVPLGGTGELYIGGSGVARGYVGQAALTAERFVADPAGRGRRLYRTGDLVRSRADGNFEFVTRADTQVKIRGVRIEPTAIESVIDRHPRVAASVVVPYEPSPGDRRLAGYVVARPDTELGLAELRRFLERELPASMMPSAFVVLDTLPLSTNGKIDRTALPEPDSARPELTTTYTAPETALQRKLADIVSAVVGVEPLGLDDNFFEVGGDSILAIQVAIRAREAGLRLAPYDVFTNPTVAGLAEVAGAGPVIDAEQGDVSGPVPLAPSQRWWCAAKVADPHRWTVSAQLELREDFPAEAVRTAVEALLAHHDGVRQRILVAGGATRVRVAPRGDATPFTVHELGELGQTEQHTRFESVVEDLRASLDLAVGPLVRVALVRAAGRPDRLFVVAHRLVADDESLRILLTDLTTALTQLAAGRAVRLPAKTTSWQSWVRRLTAHGKSEAVVAQRGYWAELVRTPAARLPADETVPAEADIGAEARTCTTRLARAEADDLLALPATLGCPLPDVLLAALGRTLSSWTGSDRHLVDFHRDDRAPSFDEVDLTRTVGLFGYAHPVALSCAADSPPEDSLRAVKEHLRKVPAGGAGWELLRQDADPIADPRVELVFRHRVTGEAVLTYDDSPRNRRRYPLEVLVTVDGRDVIVEWTYCRLRHRDESVGRIAERYLGEVRAMIELGRGGHLVHTPSDFPLARVDQTQLDVLLNRL